MESSTPSVAAPSPPPPPGGPGGGGGAAAAAAGLAALSLLDTTLQAFTAALQGMVTAGVVLALTSPSPAAPGGKVAHLSLFHLHFGCRVAGDSYLSSIWEAVAQGRDKTEGVVTLKQALLRGLPSSHKVLEGRAHFSASLPLLALVKTVSLVNRFTPWLNRKGTVEASTRGGADASLLDQQLYGRLSSADSLRTAA